MANATCAAIRQFLEEVREVVRLYLGRPDAALVLCVDEKTRLQAQESATPVLCRMVIADMRRRHRLVEFREFFKTLDERVPAALYVQSSVTTR